MTTVTFSRHLLIVEILGSAILNKLDCLDCHGVIYCSNQWSWYGVPCPLLPDMGIHAHVHKCPYYLSTTRSGPTHAHVHARLCEPMPAGMDTMLMGTTTLALGHGCLWARIPWALVPQSSTTMTNRTIVSYVCGHDTTWLTTSLSRYRDVAIETDRCLRE